MRHKWDDPKNKMSAICLKCGCQRLAEKFSTGVGWVYLPLGGHSYLANLDCSNILFRISIKNVNQ